MNNMRMFKQFGYKWVLPAMFFITTAALSAQEIIAEIQYSTSCNEHISIPVTVKNCYGVGAISLVVEFDHSKLSYTGYQNKHPLLAGFFFVNEDDGMIILSWASLNPVNISNGVLIEYNFVSSGGVSLLHFDTVNSGNCEFSDANGNRLPAEFISGQAAVSQPGLLVDAGSDLTITCGEMVTLTADVCGGIPPYTFDWGSGSTDQSISLVPYETTLVSLSVFDSINCSNSDEILINVLPAASQQIITLHQGWSGISSFIEATDPSVGTIFFNAESQIISLADLSGNYYFPANGVNTIINWNCQQGYFVKISENRDVIFYGNLHQGKTITVSEGWNLVPVLSECPAYLDQLLDGCNVVIVKEVAGPLIFWPEHGISTLELFAPGKSYYLYAGENFEFVYPDCTN
jgi:hypothetical protein